MGVKARTRFIITGALIAAAYAGLTYLSNVFGLAYGPIQLRISEMLCVLPVFSPAAIYGLTIGCFLANIGSFNAIDMIFGTLATFIAAMLTYFLRDVKIKGLPIASMLMPVLVNSVIIGLEISLFFLEKDAGLWGYILSALQIGAGELITCVGFGIPFYQVVKKYRIFK